MKRHSTLLLVYVALFTGCGIIETREDIQKREEEKQLRDQVANIQRSKADTDVRYSDLQNDIRVIAGRVESAEYNQRQSQAANQKDLEALKKTIDGQNERIKALEAHVEATEAKLVAAMKELNAPPAAVPAASAPAEKNSSKKNSTFSLFDEAENLYGAKEFKKAIVKYQSFREKSPKSDRAPDATYRIGQCFLELGMKKDAKEFFQETVETYPKSAAAQRARKKLKAL